MDDNLLEKIKEVYGKTLEEMHENNTEQTPSTGTSTIGGRGCPTLGQHVNVEEKHSAFLSFLKT